MAQRPVCGVHAGQDVLEEGVVGPALRRRAEEVAPPRIAVPGVAVPLLDRVGRIGQHHVEGAQPVPIGEGRALQRVAAGDGNPPRRAAPGSCGRWRRSCGCAPGRRAQGAVLAAAALHLVQRRDQHAAGAAGRVVDALAGCGSSICTIRWTTVRLV